jgi:hypothetical protein
MPFDHPIPHPFTAGGVRAYAPETSGVYGISNKMEWIYIGAAESIQDALLDHLESVGTPLMKREPTGFVFEVCDGSHRPRRHSRLVLEYEPICNRRSSP